MRRPKRPSTTPNLHTDELARIMTTHDTSPSTQAGVARNILVVYYSQTGQLQRVLESVLAPLRTDATVEVTWLHLEPETPFPFPWPFFRFINTFPEAAHGVPCALKTPDIALRSSYDLVVLGYTVWFLSPSIPVSSFLQGPLAAQLLRDTPVITVIACRDMWLMAQERVKAHLARLGGKLIGNIALIDAAGTAASFFATPLWMLTGRRGPFRFGIPKAGVSEQDIAAASRFGAAIKDRFDSDTALDSGLLRGLGAVQVNTNQIASEKIATRSFHLWGKLFLLAGKPGALARQLLALVYALFLILMIVTVVPLNFLLKKLFAPLLTARNDRLRHYFAQPSGEERHRLSPQSLSESTHEQ